MGGNVRFGVFVEVGMRGSNVCRGGKGTEKFYRWKENHSTWRLGLQKRMKSTGNYNYMGNLREQSFSY